MEFIVLLKPDVTVYLHPNIFFCSKIRSKEYGQFSWSVIAVLNLEGLREGFETETATPTII